MVWHLVGLRALMLVWWLEREVEAEEAKLK